MANEKNKPKLAELLSKTSNGVVSSNDTILDLMNQNLVILTQISDNFYNIAGKLGARISSMKEVESAILEEDKQAAPVIMPRQEPQAVAVSRNNKTKPKKQSSGFGLTALGIALMMGKDIIDGMINFFKNPFEIISNLLGSLGEGIVEWFEEGGFKSFVVDAFNEGKKELTKTFENLRDVFKILIGDPIANLIDDVKLSFISVSMSGLKMLPDWLKGDSVKKIETNLEKSKGNIEAGKETRAKENQTTRSELKKRNATPAVSSAEPPKQTVQDVKSEAPQQPPASQQSTTRSIVSTPTAAPAQQQPVATSKTSPEEAQVIPSATEKTPPSTKVAVPVEKPTAGGTTTPSIGPDDKEIMEMIKRHEGVRTKPYKDSLGLWTVGVGHLIGNGKTLPPEWNRELSMAEVDELFYKDYMSHKKAAMKIPGFNLVNAKAQGALIDLTFNMGNSWFKKWPNFVRNLSEGNTIGAAASLEDSNWYRQVKGRAVTIVSLIKQGASNAMGVAPSPSTGVQTAQAGADVNASKRKTSSQVVYNINNNVATAVKVGAPQGSSTTVARPVGTG